jgi:DNA-binding LacI/PurR family transcriptional regulator
MIDRASPIPYYYQIKKALSDRIASGDYGPGDKLPSELELARQNDVSPMTVRQAYKELEASGLVLRRQGLGTFVSVRSSDKNLSRKRGVDIGILMNSLRGDGLFFAELLQGIEAGSHASGFNTHLLSANGKKIQDAANDLLKTMFEKGQIDGVIAIGTFSAPDLDYLDACGIPVVFIDSDYRRFPIHAVLLDDAGYVKAWTQSLFAAGFRDIALLCGERSVERSDIQRRADRMEDGFRQAFISARRRCPSRRVLHSSSSDQGAVVRRLLEASPRPQAVIVNGDELTYELLQACAELRVSVPDDLVVINYGDGAHSPCCQAPKPLQEMGSQAVDLLRKLIKKARRIPEKVILPLNLTNIDAHAMAAPTAGSRLS